MSGVGSSGSATGFDAAEFRRVLGHYPTGVTVVTATTPSGPEGMTIGSFTSVSLDPPMVSFCPGRDSDSWAKMRPVGSFCVNVLSDEQSTISSVFASRVDDRFADINTRVEVTGSPVIEGCLGWIDCTLAEVHAVGDHHIVVGEVVALGSGRSAGGPLVFFKGGYWQVAQI